MIKPARAVDASQESDSGKVLNRPDGRKANDAKGATSAALDQYRGLALILVLISHGWYYANQSNGIGRVGVNLFFFISGILVFRSLNSSSSVALDVGARMLSFWKKRIIRLLPAMLAYLLIMAAVVFALQGLPNLPPHSSFADYVHSLPLALSFSLDYYRDHPPSISHLWSVSVEMQYYLLAPLIFFAGGRSNRQRIVVWSIVLLILIFMGISEPLRGYQERYAFQVTVWPMMLGFFLEFLKRWVNGVPQAWLVIAVRAGWAASLLTMLMMLFSAQKILVVAAGTIIFIPCFLSYISNQSIPGRMGRALAWLGERTYSTYLWQQPLTLCDYIPDALQPIGAALSVPIGALWYHFFERPFLSSKRRAETK